MKVEAYFIAALAEDGQIFTLPEMPEEGIEAKRPVNNYDVYQTAKQIVDEFEQSLLAQRVAETVIRAMAPTQTSPSDKVKDALKERGFKTE
jgi:hypothetical protein